jgi:hypothetical protein
LAGCGSSASPTATPEATKTEAPTATPEPTAGLSGTPGTDIRSATSALAGLGSYRFAILIKGFGTAATAGDAAMSMDGTVVLKPAQALQFRIVGLTGSTAITYIVIGKDSWMDLGSGIYIQVPADQVDAEQLFESFQPANLFGSAMSGLSSSGWQPEGDEQKNGVTATHYHVDKTSPGGASLVASWGETGVFDAWIAKDGGYLVSLRVAGDMQSGKAAPFEIGFDISGIDDPANVITAPPT